MKKSEWRFWLLVLLGLLLTYRLVEQGKTALTKNREQEQINRELTAAFDRLALLRTGLKAKTNQISGADDLNDAKAHLIQTVSAACERYRLQLADCCREIRDSVQNRACLIEGITVEGEFHGLVKLMHEVESGRIPGRLLAAEMVRMDDKKKASQYVQLELWIQTCLERP